MAGGWEPTLATVALSLSYVTVRCMFWKELHIYRVMKESGVIKHRLVKVGLTSK